MGQFTGEFDLSPYPDGKTWFVLNAIGYVCDDGTRVDIPEGRETDFASVPRIAWTIFPPWGKYGPASIVHDELYWDQALPRERADAIFLEAMGTLGVSFVTRQTLYHAVRWFGQHAWDDNAWLKTQGVTRIGTRTSPAFPQWSR